MRKITRSRTLLAVLLFACAGASAQVPAGRLWTYQYLLVTSVTERELAPISEHIFHDGTLQVPELGDYAAEVLLARWDDSNYPLQNKLRLVRVVGAMGSARYNDVLDQLMARATLDEAKSELRDARKKGKEAAPSYVPGSLDIQAIVRETEAAALAAKPTTDRGRHLSAFRGGSIDELFEYAGKPHQVVSGQTRVSDGLLIHVKIQRISFFYRGLGRVVYGYKEKADEWQFQAVVADPLAFEQEFSYRDRATELGLPDDASLEMMQLVSNYTASMKNVVEQRHRRGNPSLEFTDTAAEVLARQFQTARDPVTIDMYAWICRLLTQYGGNRYVAVLETVASQTSDPKLKRFANLPIQPDSKLPQDAYVPGTISLDAQRAKYPPLYPDSTYQSGRL